MVMMVMAGKICRVCECVWVVSGLSMCACGVSLQLGLSKHSTSLRTSLIPSISHSSTSSSQRSPALQSASEHDDVVFHEMRPEENFLLD